MGTTENNRVRIQQAVRETERLISQKQNNLAMIKARQTLEFIISCLGEQALIVDGDLADSIDQLYEGRWISQTAKNHFHRIRVIGNKAVHEGNDSPYDANEAYQLLAQEVHAFLSAGEARNGSGASQRPPQRQSGQRPPSQAPRNTYPQRSSHSNGSHSGHRPSSVSRSRRRPKRRGFNPYALVRPALVLIIILILAFTAFAFLGKKEDKKQSSAAPTTSAFTTAAPETLPPETEPETTAAPQIIYKTTATPKLNVRETPATDGKILGTLAPGTIVDYVSAYSDDNTWSVINFEGKQAYVSSQFLSAQKADSDEDGAAAPTFENGDSDQAANSTKASAAVNTAATKAPAKTETKAAAKPKSTAAAKPKATTATKPKAKAAAKPKTTTAVKPKAATAAKPKATTAAKPTAAPTKSATAAPKPVPATEPVNTGNGSVPTISNKPAS